MNIYYTTGYKGLRLGYSSPLPIFLKTGLNIKLPPQYLILTKGVKMNSLSFDLMNEPLGNIGTNCRC